MDISIRGKHRIYIKDKISYILDLSTLYHYMFMTDTETFKYLLNRSYIDKRSINPMKLYTSSIYYQNIEYYKVIYAGIHKGVMY